MSTMIDLSKVKKEKEIITNNILNIKKEKEMFDLSKVKKEKEEQTTTITNNILNIKKEKEEQQPLKIVKEEEEDEFEITKLKKEKEIKEKELKEIEKLLLKLESKKVKVKVKENKKPIENPSINKKITKSKITKSKPKPSIPKSVVVEENKKISKHAVTEKALLRYFYTCDDELMANHFLRLDPLDNIENNIETMFDKFLKIKTPNDLALSISKKDDFTEILFIIFLFDFLSGEKKVNWLDKIDDSILVDAVKRLMNFDNYYTTYLYPLLFISVYSRDRFNLILEKKIGTPLFNEFNLIDDIVEQEEEKEEENFYAEIIDV
jgi:hypothetical protein